MITEDYVSFETAKLLKEKWFKFLEDPDKIAQAYIHAYTKEGKEVWGCYDPEYCPCITLNMACKWLRLVHHLYVHVVIYCDQESGPYWNWFIDNTETGQTVGENTSLIQCESPEEAYNDGIKYCLENLIK